MYDAVDFERCHHYLLTASLHSSCFHCRLSSLGIVTIPQMPGVELPPSHYRPVFEYLDCCAFVCLSRWQRSKSRSGSAGGVVRIDKYNSGSASVRFGIIPANVTINRIGCTSREVSNAFLFEYSYCSLSLSNSF